MLAKLTVPSVNAFRDDLLASMSRPLARSVMVSLKSILKDAMRRGNVAQNVALSVSIASTSRGKRKLRVGTDVPSVEEIRRLIAALKNDRWRAVILVAIFTGLRASELRGLRWADIDLKKRGFVSPNALIVGASLAHRNHRLANAQCR